MASQLDPAESPKSADEAHDLARADRLRERCHAVRQQVAKAVVGQSHVIDQLLIAMLARGHCLLEGVPGLAKTLMIRSLAESMDLTFHRIQFTPDLMPADITGTDIIQESQETGHRELIFERGPIFSQMVLADEINRTPPKTQAALLEAMQEHEVTVGGTTYKLAEPFFVLATQNPIEQEGTYPLPEAQRDRFLFQVTVDYPTRSQEASIIDRTTSDKTPQLTPVISGDEMVEFQTVVRRVPLADNVKQLVLDIVRSLRPGGESPFAWVGNLLDWGPGPRACQQLVLAAKARALLEGRYHVTCEDIHELALPVLRHRLVPSFSAESEGLRADDIVSRASCLKYAKVTPQTDAFMPPPQLVKVDDRKAIAQLQIFARHVVDGISGGRHRSTHKGASVVFKEHRQYARGDEIRSIDWKLFGKTDRLFIRQYEDEANLRAMILLDQSGSMKYQGSRTPELSKHDFAVRLAACLATLLIRQQDAVGLTLIDTAVRGTLPPRSNPGHLQAILQTLLTSVPAGETSLANALTQAAGVLPRRGLLLVLSDCFDDADGLVKALRLYRRHGHEVVVFQIWDPDELDFPFRNRTEFRSMENGLNHLVDPVALQQAYLERLKVFQQQLDVNLARERIELVKCQSSQSCGEVLAEFIAGRRRLRRETSTGSGSP